MAEKNEVVETKAEETVSKAEYERVVAENKKLRNAIDRLVNAMAQRYAQDLYKEVLGE